MASQRSVLCCALAAIAVSATASHGALSISRNHDQTSGADAVLWTGGRVKRVSGTVSAPGLAGVQDVATSLTLELPEGNVYLEASGSIDLSPTSISMSLATLAQAPDHVPTIASASAFYDLRFVLDQRARARWTGTVAASDPSWLDSQFTVALLDESTSFLYKFVSPTVEPGLFSFEAILEPGLYYMIAQVVTEGEQTSFGAASTGWTTLTATFSIPAPHTSLVLSIAGMLPAARARRSA